MTLIEDLDFKYTTISLNDVYGLSYRHALELIERNGGKINDDEIKIKIQDPVPVPLEENFPDYVVLEKRNTNTRFNTTEKQELKFEFEGIGVVLKGRMKNKNFGFTYGLESEEQTINGYKVETEFYIDGEMIKKLDQPLSFIERNHELFFQYELTPGKHELVMKVLNPHPDVIIEVGELIVYGK